MEISEKKLDELFTELSGLERQLTDVQVMLMEANKTLARIEAEQKVIHHPIYRGRASDIELYPTYPGRTYRETPSSESSEEKGRDSQGND